MNEGRDAPIFVVGAPRSGTTMLRLMLNSHPRIAVPGETEFFRHHYQRPGERSLRPWPEAVNRFVNDCARMFRPSVDLEPTRQRLLGLPERNYAELLSGPMTAWASAQGKARWGEKTPMHIFFGPDIAELFPQAMVITILRDPRAVIASMNRSPHFGARTTLHTWMWHDMATRGRSTLKASFSGRQVMEVSYEAFVQQPGEELRRVCEFLGEEYSPSMLEFHRSASNYHNSIKTPKLTEPVRDEHDAWRRYLTPSEVATIELICGDDMERLGYQRDGVRAGVRERADAAVKLAYVRLKQAQHREQRYHEVTYGIAGNRLSRFRRPTAVS